MLDRQSARALIMHPQDDVGLVLSALKPGDRLIDTDVVASEEIAAGHKIALRDIDNGALIRKYGAAIGKATQKIARGAHVHLHNVSADIAANVGDGASKSATRLAPREAFFNGYLRANGAVGTRNYIGIVSTVNCSATVARRIAEAFPDDLFADEEGVDGVVAFTHTTGCGTPSQGEGVDNLTRTLGGYLRHPNFAGIVLIGLGCEVNQVERVLREQALETGARLRAFTIQDVGGTAKAIAHGKALVKELLEIARPMRRAPVSAAHLTLGLQCGGSDGWSGVTANPALGVAADILVACGGTAILSETPEIYGAEPLLFARAVDTDVRAALQERLDWWRDYAARHGAELNNNPSPGNLKGGLTTILEKSLGAVAKSGSSPLMGVYRYGEPITRKGFVFMDSPGYDPCSATGQTAAGANILAFTTGRGSVFGSKPAPCIKLASNEAMARHMDDDMDIDCSPVLAGAALADLGEAIFQKLLAIASGEKSKSEALGIGDHEFVPWQLGAVM